MFFYFLWSLFSLSEFPPLPLCYGYERTIRENDYEVADDNTYARPRRDGCRLSRQLSGARTTLPDRPAKPQWESLCSERVGRPEEQVTQKKHPQANLPKLFVKHDVDSRLRGNDGEEATSYFLLSQIKPPR